MDKITVRGSKFALIGLQDMINDIPTVARNAMVEIGCYVGDSTQVFAKNFKSMYAVDPWENGYDDTDQSSYIHPMWEIEKQFDEMKSNYNNIIKYKMESIEAVEKFKNESIDLIYIDALHTYLGCKNDIELWLPKIKKGGYLCGHDYQGRFPGVIRAVDEAGGPDKTYRDTSWMIKV